MRAGSPDPLQTLSAPASIDAIRDRLEQLWGSRAAFARYTDWLFQGVSLEDRRFLDIGGGTGEFSVYAALSGARTVTCLEPGAAGAMKDLRNRFDNLVAGAGLSLRLVEETFQNFHPEPSSFDVVLLHNSINHLDESATIRLHEHESARSTYRGLFKKLASALSPGGRVVIADCARSNLFPMLGLRHPISRDIEWHKHQDPGLWIALLSDAGFENPSVSWSSYNRFGRIGWGLLANRVGAFLLTGHFRIVMQTAKTATPTAQ